MTDFLDVTSSDFWVGACLGLLVGMLFEEAVEMIWSAYKEMKMNRKKPSLWSRAMERMNEVNFFVKVIAVQGLIMVLMAVVMVVQYARLTSFQDCQAQYNIDTSETRSKRLQDSDRTEEKLVEWGRSVKHLFDSSDKSEKDQKIALAKVSQTLAAWLRAYDEKVRTQERNPYKSPSDFCGKEPDSAPPSP